VTTGREITHGAHCEPDSDGHCAICGDEAIEAKVLAVDDAAGLAHVELLEGGARAAIALDLVEEIQVGDVLLVHQGFAIGRVAPENPT
jgi:hydrogenase maturation factor